MNDSDCPIGDPMHEFKAVIDSQFSNDIETSVRCVKCGMPGSRIDATGEVFYPAT